MGTTNEGATTPKNVEQLFAQYSAEQLGNAAKACFTEFDSPLQGLMDVNAFGKWLHVLQFGRPFNYKEPHTDASRIYSESSDLFFTMMQADVNNEALSCGIQWLDQINKFFYSLCQND